MFLVMLSSFLAIWPAVNSPLSIWLSTPGLIRSAQYTAFHSHIAKQDTATPKARL